MFRPLTTLPTYLTTTPIAKFHDGITSKRLEILTWNFVWHCIMTICLGNGPMHHPTNLPKTILIANFGNLDRTRPWPSKLHPGHPDSTPAVPTQPLPSRLNSSHLDLSPAIPTQPPPNLNHSNRLFMFLATCHLCSFFFIKSKIFIISYHWNHSLSSLLLIVQATYSLNLLFTLLLQKNVIIKALPFSLAFWAAAPIGDKVL